MMKTIKSHQAVASVAKGILLVLLLTIGNVFGIIGFPEADNKTIYGEPDEVIPQDPVKGHKRLQEVYKAIKFGGSTFKIVIDYYAHDGKVLIANKETFIPVDPISETMILQVLNTTLAAYPNCIWRRGSAEVGSLAYVLFNKDSPYAHRVAGKDAGPEPSLETVFGDPGTRVAAMVITDKQSPRIILTFFH